MTRTFYLFIIVFFISELTNEVYINIYPVLKYIIDHTFLI